MAKALLWAALVLAVLAADDKAADDDPKAVALGKPPADDNEDEAKGGFRRWFNWSIFKKRPNASALKELHTILVPDAIAKGMAEADKTAMKEAANRAIFACFHTRRPGTFSLLFFASAQTDAKATKWQFVLATKARRNKMRYIFTHTLDQSTDKDEARHAMPLRLAFSDTVADIFRFARLQYDATSGSAEASSEVESAKEAAAVKALEDAQAALLSTAIVADKGDKSDKAEPDGGQEKRSGWSMSAADDKDDDKSVGLRRGYRLQKLDTLMPDRDKAKSHDADLPNKPKSGVKDEEKLSDDGPKAPKGTEADKSDAKKKDSDEKQGKITAAGKKPADKKDDGKSQEKKVAGSQDDEDDED